jgi:hypothetical protein
MYFKANPQRQQSAITAHEAYMRRRRTRRGYRFEDVVHADNLIRVFNRLKREAGQASGPDGVRFRELGPKEVGDWMRRLASSVKDGTFDVGGRREIQIDKRGGGTRTIRIRGLQYRVLAAALQEALDPFIDPVFLRWSYGFRRNRNVQKLIAQLLHDVEAYGLWCVVQDDVRKAFDCVDVTVLMGDINRYVKCKKTLALLEKMLLAEVECDLNWNGIGIDQGNAISPMCLNVRLHRVHDRLVESDVRVPSWYRYADNLLYLAHGVREGERLLRRVRRLLEPTEFELKGMADGGITNLRTGEMLNTLGFSVRWTTWGWEFNPSMEAWNALDESLKRAHRSENPSLNALAAVRSWIAFNGPSFTERGTPEFAARVLAEAARFGFGEIGIVSEVAAWMRDAHSSWIEVVNVTAS